jgi:hypothetical protein
MNHELVISAGTVDITPERPSMLGGYNKRTDPFTAVADRLEGNVLIIKDSTSRVVIVSTDLLYPGDALRNELLKALSIVNNESELFLCASHTHYAPMTALSMPRLGVADLDYVRFVAARITALIKSIEQTGNVCIATYHEGAANHSINRRLRCFRVTSQGLARNIGMGPNPEGERDEQVRILKFCEPGGQPLALIWNYACHAADSVDGLKVSAAFPGVVRSRFRSDLGRIPVLFLQGFSGNVRPPFTGTSFGVKGLVRRALLGPRFRTPRRPEWQAWSNSLADCVASFAQSSPRRLQVGSPMAKRIEVPEDEFAIGGDGNKPLVWHLIDCGELRIVGINAEPMVQYRKLLAKSLGDVPLLTAGCLDQTQCYLPSDEMIPEGGYEVEGFRPLFNFKGRFREKVQDPVIQRLTRTATQPRRGNA